MGGLGRGRKEADSTRRSLPKRPPSQQESAPELSRTSLSPCCTQPKLSGSHSQGRWERHGYPGGGGPRQKGACGILLQDTPSLHYESHAARHWICTDNPLLIQQSLRDRLVAELGPRFHSVEEYRLQQSDKYQVHWKRWGPYVSERQWGTVREDYSANGDAWNSFPFEMAQSRAYRWGEDGMAGIS